jgi:hypothetical protein
MSEAELSEVAIEVECVAKQVRIRGRDLRVLDTDTEVAVTRDYRGSASIREVAGGGGTDMSAGIAAAVGLRPAPNAVVVVIDGFAAELAPELLLGAGDPVRARRAVDKGPLGAPYAERPWVQLVAVADALGEAHEVERILADMDRRLGLDGDFDQLHPDTVAACRRDSRRNKRKAL